ncbi:carbohydrate ABC transporter permease [Alicyclobacillus acidiphilus]|uniref:carbohydrate ABC transporter permease n=1 Tax=Alicyclobacillus acidiphilus TaxID=182455 RepID=UPI0009F84AA9|nr:sugar ABC transporter permease [Alicyclobacillus acidiphilus]
MAIDSAVTAYSPGQVNRFTRVGPGKSKDLLVAALFLVPAFAFLIVFVYFPTVLAFVLAFFNYHPGGSMQWAGVSNFTEAVKDSVFQRALLNSLYYAAMMVPATLVLSMAIALLINRVAKFYSFVRVLITLPYVTPAIGTAIGWLWIYNPSFGVANTILHWFHLPPSQWMGSPKMAMPAVVIYALWHGIGFDVIILLAALSGLPKGVLEAAIVDGARGWTRFFRVTLPLISPTVFFIVVVTLIGSFQAFSQMFALSVSSGGPEYATTTALLYIYQQAFQYGQMSYGAAMAVFLVVGIFLLTMITRWIGNRVVFYQ